MAVSIGPGTIAPDWTLGVALTFGWIAGTIRRRGGLDTRCGGPARSKPFGRAVGRLDLRPMLGEVIRRQGLVG